MREFNVGSLNLIAAFLLLSFGLIFGLTKWYQYSSINTVAPTGTIIIPAIAIIMGYQSILSFLQFDVNNYPKKPLSSSNKELKLKEYGKLNV